jgi:DNA polymerase/3'-5' exonuclease PolX
MRPAIRALAHNRRIAERLDEAARLLEAQGATRYHVRSYRDAARSVASHPRALARVFQEHGVKGLDALPRVGLGIAAAIAEMLATGRWSRLERLRAASRPEALFRSLPGLGPALARRIRDELHVASLEGLREAAHDGRLESLRGVGLRRAHAWRAVLDDMLDGAPASLGAMDGRTRGEEHVPWRRREPAGSEGAP